MSSPTPTMTLDSPSPGFTRLTQFLADKDRVSRLALTVAAGSLLVAAAAVGLSYHQSQRPVLFVVLDAEANVIPVAGSPFPEAKELHVKEALLASSALLSRNPHGFDQPEVLEALFSKSALEAARKVNEAEGREFAENQIQQKPQIGHIAAISTHGNQVQVQVTGEVARWGFVQQAPFSDSLPFTLDLVLRFNPDLLRQRHQPLIVDHFTLTYAPSTR